MTQIVSIDSFFKSHPKLRKGGGAYTRYVRGIKRARAVANDPLRTYSDAELQAQAQRAIDSAVQPVVSSITKKYGDQGIRTAAAIDALTRQYVDASRGYAPEVAAGYGQAESSQAASDAALASLLQGGGTGLATELAGKLGGGAPAAVAAPAVARGSAGASYATGSADIARLIAQAAAARDYGAKLPGIAANEGLRAQEQSSKTLNQELADAIGQITTAVPGQVGDLFRQLKSNNTQTALAKASGLLDTQKAVVDTQYKSARVRQTGAAQAERARHDRAQEQNARDKAATKAKGAPNAALSKVYGYVVDQYGRAIVGPDGRRQPVKTTKGAQNTAGAKRTKAFYTVRDKAFNKARSLYGSGGSGGATGKGSLHSSSGRSRPTWDAAYGSLSSQYGPTLTQQYGFSQAAVRQMLRRALIAAGFVPPSGYGAKATG